MKAFQIMMVMSLVVLLGACAASYKHVSVQELHSTKEPNYILLDVRQPEEYDEVQVANSMLIPLGELALRTSELSKDVPL